MGGVDHDSQWSRLFGANGIVSTGAWVARARSLRRLDVLDVLEALPQLSAEAALPKNSIKEIRKLLKRMKPVLLGRFQKIWLRGVVDNLTARSAEKLV